MSGSPLSISLSPLGIIAPGGNANAYVKVRANGSGVMTVKSSSMILRVHANKCALHLSNYVHITPGQFKLSGGQTQSVHIVLANVPANVRNLAAVFTGSVAGKGNVSISASVASQVTLHGGKLLNCNAAPLPHAGFGRLDYLWIAIAILFALGVLSGFTLYRRRHIR